MGVLQQPYEGLHIMFEEAHTNERFKSCNGHQLYAFKGRGVDLEVEGVRYIEMHCGPKCFLFLFQYFFVIKFYV